MGEAKIDVVCGYCDSHLRVDAVHAGKQIRCPNCQNISDIPGSPEPTRTEFEIEYEHYQNRLDPNTPRSVPEPQAHPQYHPPQRQWSPVNIRDDSQAKAARTGLTIGILGIVLNVFCGCFLPFMLALNIYGLVVSMNSSGPMRGAAITTNTIALAISGVMFCFYFVTNIMF